MLPYMDNSRRVFPVKMFCRRRSPLLKARSLDRRLDVRGYVVEEEEENGGGGKQFRNSVCSLFLEVLFV